MGKGREVKKAWSVASVCALVFFLWTDSSTAAGAPPLVSLSLEELSNVEVTSVSKAAEALSQSPASIYVISREDIQRAGVTSVGEALRLAPNLLISQYSASNYIAGARGFGGAQEAQNFSNKLLILIDGRSTYSPLYSGVYLDVQDVLMEDIDRIEVISGPGATLWGANAMNGVINIITRPSYLTTQDFVFVGAGNREQIAGARMGGNWGRSGSYRVYAKAFDRDPQELEDKTSAHDDWRKVQTGFRADWTSGERIFTTQGDVYQGRQKQIVSEVDGDLDLDEQDVNGGNLLARWRQGTAGNQWQVQAYYDFTERAAPDDGVAFWLRTYDVEVQHSRFMGVHRLIGGAGIRWHDYDIRSTDSLQFDPEHRVLKLGNVFFQDTMSLTASVSLTAGLKFERDGFGRWSPLPDLRLAWRVTPTTLMWTSASRAIRSPTPFDRDVIEVLGGTTFLVGNGSFDPERVDAIEIGMRMQPSPTLSASTSFFFNRYDDLRSIELDPDSGFLPLRWGNGMHGRTYGLEAWGNWQVASWWRLSPGLRILRKDLAFDDHSSGLAGYRQSGNDPKSHALLTSAMDLGPRIRLNATFRYVGTLPSPRLDDHSELGASLQFQFSRSVELAVTGLNLLSERHAEYPAPSGEYIRRAVLAQIKCRF